MQKYQALDAEMDPYPPDYERDDPHWRDVYLATDVDAHVAEKVARYTLRISDLERRVDELETEVQDLQVALAFWLPGVPDNDPQIAKRAGDDSMLLAGLDSDTGPDAELLGWITLRPVP